jgi:hypothetical protein
MKLMASSGLNFQSTDGALVVTGTTAKVFCFPTNSTLDHLDSFTDFAFTSLRQGTRWNAKKDPDGYYFSTRKWAFTMTCHSCPMKMVIATDPKNSDYEYRSGIRKMVEEPTADEELDEVSAVVQEKLDQLYHKGGHAAEEERQEKQSHHMMKMEREQDHKRKASTEGERFEVLVELGETRRLYDGDANAALRQGMRVKRRAAEALVRETKDKQLSISLLPASEEDRVAARAALAAERRSLGGPALLSSSSSSPSSHPNKLSARMLEVASSSVFGDDSRPQQTKQTAQRAAVLASTVPLLSAASAALGKFERSHGLARGSAASGDAHRQLLLLGRKSSSGGAAANPPTVKTTKLRKKISRPSSKPRAIESGENRSKTSLGDRASATPAAPGSPSPNNPLTALTSMYAESDED